jgi:23S rRNA G2069 N7-methylase RlmK/C1962 C5-methylase RlmI
MFLNTHTYPRKKFKQQMKRILEERKNSFIQLQEISMHTDCPIKKQFPEGDYLKGVVWQRVDKAEI